MTAYANQVDHPDGVRLYSFAYDAGDEDKPQWHLDDWCRQIGIPVPTNLDDMGVDLFSIHGVATHEIGDIQNQHPFVTLTIVYAEDDVLTFVYIDGKWASYHAQDGKQI